MAEVVAQLTKQLDAESLPIVAGIEDRSVAGAKTTGSMQPSWPVWIRNRCIRLNTAVRKYAKTYWFLELAMPWWQRGRN
jgi:hypothetical protein